MIGRIALLMLALGIAAARAEDAVSAGRALAFDRSKGNCLACHTMQGGDVPSTVGPELKGIKALYPNRADLVAILWDEGRRNPQTAMLPFGRNMILSKPEIEQIVDFLYTL